MLAGESGDEHGIEFFVADQSKRLGDVAETEVEAASCGNDRRIGKGADKESVGGINLAHHRHRSDFEDLHGAYPAAGSDATEWLTDMRSPSNAASNRPAYSRHEM